MRRSIFLLAAALALGACGSFHDDMKMMCEAPAHVDPVGLSQAERAEAISQYIAEHTRSGEARTLFQNLATVAPDDRKKLLDDAVTRAGIKPEECEMLRSFE